MTADPKSTLRKEARRHRAFTRVEASDFDAAADLFFESIQPPSDCIISAYWPKGKEFDPIPVLEKFSRQGGRCCLPVMQPDSRILKFLPWTNQMELVKGPHEILQPKVDEGAEWCIPDIVIVPLLAFDQSGNRLGQGGGYYDATLKALRAQKSIIAAGFAYASQACLFRLPQEDHDEKLDCVVTPQKVYRF